MAMQQAMGTESMARELSVCLDAMELQADASAALWNHRQTGIGESETLGLELPVAAGGCARKAGQPEKVQSEGNMADLE